MYRNEIYKQYIFEWQAPVRLRENANDLLTIPPLSVPTMLRNQVDYFFPELLFIFC